MAHKALMIILDSTNFVRDPYLESNASQQLIGARRSRAWRLAVPEVVVQEVVKKYQDIALEASSKLKTAHETSYRYKLLSRKTRKEILIDPERLAKKYEKKLRELLEKAGVLILPIPSVTHQDIVSRALARQKPFDSAGHNGYRDTLIWETVLIASKRYDVVFISANKRDFCDFDDTELASSLQREIDENASIQYYSKIADLIEKEFEPAQRAQAQLREQLQDSKFLSKLEAQLDSLLPDITGVDIDLVDDLEMEVMEGHDSERYAVDDLEVTRVDIHSADVSRARKVNQNEIYVEIHVSGEADISYYLRKREDLAQQKKDDEIPKYILGEITTLLEVTLDAVYVPMKNELRKVELAFAIRL